MPSHGSPAHEFVFSCLEFLCSYLEFPQFFGAKIKPHSPQQPATDRSSPELPAAKPSHASHTQADASALPLFKGYAVQKSS